MKLDAPLQLYSWFWKQCGLKEGGHFRPFFQCDFHEKEYTKHLLLSSLASGIRVVTSCAYSGLHSCIRHDVTSGQFSLDWLPAREIYDFREQTWTRGQSREPFTWQKSCSITGPLTVMVYEAQSKRPIKVVIWLLNCVLSLAYVKTMTWLGSCYETRVSNWCRKLGCIVYNLFRLSRLLNTIHDIAAIYSVMSNVPFCSQGQNNLE
jgi:hypothetical protein